MYSHLSIIVPLNKAINSAVFIYHAWIVIKAIFANIASMISVYDSYNEYEYENSLGSARVYIIWKRLG